MKESHVNVVVLQEKIKFRNIKKHQKLKEEKNKLKRNLTDEELDVFFHKAFKNLSSKKYFLMNYININVTVVKGRKKK